MNNELSAGHIRELIQALQAGLEESAGRAEKLNAEHHLKAARERQAAEAALQQHLREAGAAQAEAGRRGEEENAAAQSRFAARQARIGRAFLSSKEAALRQIDQQIGGQRYELQRRTLQAERERDAAVAATHAHFQEFRTGLAGEQEKLAHLEWRAQRLFKGYGGLLRQFHQAYAAPAADPGGAEEQLLARLREAMSRAEAGLGKLGGNLWLRLGKGWWVWTALALAALAATQAGRAEFGFSRAIPVAAGALAIGILLWVSGGRASRRAAAELSSQLAAARQLHDACARQCESHYQAEQQRLRGEFVQMAQAGEQALRQATAEAGQRRIALRLEADERTVRLNQQSEAAYRARSRRREQRQREEQQLLSRAATERADALQSAAAARLAQLEEMRQAAWQTLERDWRQKVLPVYEELRAAERAARRQFPPWPEVLSQPWTRPARFPLLAPLGSLEVDLARLGAALPKDQRLALPAPALTAPLCLAYPDEGSVLIETNGPGRDQAVAALNNLVLRLLANTPPGKASFTILDPVGLGRNFAGLMHLADYEEQLINNRIWTQTPQIEERLAELNEHLEKVIQMYLRNEYRTIAEYNEQAGVIAEKFHYLVVADFPAGFSETAIRRLSSLAASGARCGVYTLIHWDRRQPPPPEFLPDDLRANSVCLTLKGDQAVFTQAHPAGAQIQLELPPGPEAATRLVQEIGRLSRDSSRVEVPFAHVAPAEAQVWTGDTTTELRVAIGRTGATKLQELAMGKGTRQHALVAGKTGSGKSTLFHVIITNLALWCDPDQVEFYLVDFKKGVEFKCYAARRLPHARVVAIESDRDFGLSVLQRVDDELRRRGDRFRELGAQDIAGYKRAGGVEPMPRALLLVDEFQEFFVEDDKVAQTASLLLDRIVRQGRAFGIHVLLGSQTLGGAYTVARTTLGQMAIRIALQCNEADAYLIMDENNPAPRLLSRPGEGIYNDLAGALEGNSPFQVVWLDEETRDQALGRVRGLADQRGLARRTPIVFEGNAPADIRENQPLAEWLEAGAGQRRGDGRIWLGAPNSIKGPTEVIFERQSGNHLLIVGQRDEAALGMFAGALLALAAPGDPPARLIMVDHTPAGTRPREYLEDVAQALGGRVELAGPGELDAVMAGLAAELEIRGADARADLAAPVFVLIQGLQRFSRLRHEDDFSFGAAAGDAPPGPGEVLNRLLGEGPRLGFHVIASCDSYNNLNRFFSRKALSEFELRVLFQMSANDSASLIDSPKAGLLGLHRALFFNAQAGHLETFRPYALPARDWLTSAARKLRARSEEEANRRPSPP